MQKLEFYKKFANRVIDTNDFPESPMDRASQVAKDLIQSDDYYTDVHTHFFDMHCINASYFVIRFVRDLLKLRGEADRETFEEDIIDQAYEKAHIYTDDWHEKLLAAYGQEGQRGGIGSIITKLAFMTSTKDVYEYYIKDSSIAETFGLDKEKVLTTGLLMDFKHAWKKNNDYPKIKKSIYDQVIEYQKLSAAKPMLPFLFVDPRRADEIDKKENLYYLFNHAFNPCNKLNPFFGVKVYPCLGYDPNDYRLWPIYELCQKYSIPVLSHCGGIKVRFRGPELLIYEGETAVILDKNTTGLGKKYKHANKRIAHSLNDPKRWRPVLERFPNLKLNIAHFGDSKTWSSLTHTKEDEQRRKEVIKGLMYDYKHVYSDFSYTITNEVATKNFVTHLNNDADDLGWERLKTRAMFGSDYWVVSAEGQLREKQKKFIEMVGDDNLKERLCKTNPYNYLFTEV